MVEEMKGQDWVAVMVKLKGVSVLFIAAYLTSGDGAAGPNIKKLAGLMDLILEMQLPFILMADWNMEPKELKETGFIGKVGAEVVLPHSVSHTCSSGLRCSASHGAHTSASD